MPPVVEMLLLGLWLLLLNIDTYTCFPNYDTEQPFDPLLDYDRLDEAFDRGRNDTAAARRCEPCEPELCPVPLGCRAGVLPDACGCCQECGNLEGQACDPPLERSVAYYGRCGSGLTCRVPDHRAPGPEGAREQREEEEEEEEEEEGEMGDEPVCVCAEQEPVCASDGVTYMNTCQFREANFSNPRLTLKERGPCKTVPVIKVAPQNQVRGSGSSLVFLCEVFAFPMAQVEWTKEGLHDLLPGDDPHISVQSRGGPQRFELSSWLQIEGAERGDSGTYRCVARNNLGSTSASATLGVLSHDTRVETPSETSVETPPDTRVETPPPDTKVETPPDTRVETPPETRVETPPETRVETPPPDTKVETPPDTRVETPPETRVETPPETRVETPPPDTKVETPPDTRVETPPETRVETPPETRVETPPPDTKVETPPDTRVETPPETRVETPPETRVETPPPDTKVETPPDTRVETPPDTRVETPPETRVETPPPDTRVETPPETRVETPPPDTRVETPPETRVETPPPDTKVETPPETRVETPPETRVETPPPDTKVETPPDTKVETPQDARVETPPPDIGVETILLFAFTAPPKLIPCLFNRLSVCPPEELSAYLTASVSEMKEMLDYSQPRGDDHDYY
ncbi:hypothetical protein NHX12_029085 [Muraenolepis orangiensis]|uniref:Kazal-type serine protease inhibitor domain-containing protein 1-like n=1 Tax=Muraenolepis orangiensis TaxID=630683 RepID=A0A9Q0IMU4_9TELE|nr:hypothetical protein NHX12_029085 [Muraenolepis orangiensis]